MNHFCTRVWAIFCVCSLFYFYKALLQVSPDAMSTNLKHAFLVSDHRLGLLSAAFFLSCTLMQIPAGILVDRFGSRKLLTFACIIFAISSMLFAMAPYFAVVSLARLFMGLASAFVYIGGLKLIMEWFSSERFGFLNGLFSSIGMLGAIVGEEPLVRLINMISWRYSMFLLGFFGCILAILIFMIVKDKHADNIPVNKATQETLAEKLACIFKNKQLWLVSICASIIVIPYMVICNLYGIPFLATAYAVDPLTAAYMVSLILLGVGIGGFVWGAFSDYTKRRLPSLFIAAIAPPILLAFIIYYPFTHLFLLKTLLFALGFFTSAMLPAFSMACEMNKPVHIATALSVINMVMMLSAAIVLPVLGRLLDRFSTLSHDIHVYTLLDYKISFSFVMILLVIPLILLCFIKETYTKSS